MTMNVTIMTLQFERWESVEVWKNLLNFEEFWQLLIERYMLLKMAACNDCLVCLHKYVIHWNGKENLREQN